MHSGRLDGQVALITGGSRGIGRATALKLAREGASVIVNFKDQVQAAHEIVEEIHALGGRAIPARCDVAEADSVRQMVSRSVRELGPITILVNNAAVLRKGDLFSYDEAELDLMWSVNVKGVLHCTSVIAPSMMENRFGRVINVSSIAALGTPFPGTTLYSLTKAAIIILTRRLAFELGPHGINVNAVCPGFIATDMNFKDKTPDQIEKTKEMVSQKSMIGRAGEPEDIADVICFLASREATFMTGQILTADGGRMDFLSHS